MQRQWCPSRGRRRLHGAPGRDREWQDRPEGEFSGKPYAEVDGYTCVFALISVCALCVCAVCVQMVPVHGPVTHEDFEEVEEGEDRA